MPTELQIAGTDLQAFLKRIKHRVIRARSAFACCKKGYNRSQQFMIQLLELVEERFHSTPQEARVVPLPRLEPWVGVRVAPYGSGPQIGFVDLTTQAQLSAFTMPETLPELERLRKFVDVATDQLRRQTSDCQKCVEKALLNQSKARVRASLETWKPGIKDRRLMLRTPHK